MSLAGNQARTFLLLLDEIRPHVRTDRNLPARIQQRLARERRFGSRDRRLYRELLYTALRYWPWVERLQARSADVTAKAVAWLAADLPMLMALKDWCGFADAPPQSITEKAARLELHELPLPSWFRAHCPELFLSPNLEAVQTRASLWLRLQTDEPQSVLNEFDQRGWPWRRSSLLPDAIEILSEIDVTPSEAFTRGKIEIQDLGSQLVLATAQPARGSRWLDACAGAGGKTLQLARLLGPQGKVEASDPRREALEELQQRAARAGLQNVTVLARYPVSDDYDGVLVDAPCSGSGTWRRAPHLKWSTNEGDLHEMANRQFEILTRASERVRMEGLLVYATCSLSSRENAEVMARFLSAESRFKLAPIAPPFPVPAGDFGVTWLPAQHNTDGFFVSVLQRKA